eukprot:GEMP01101091.1.p1 GENE.GEMP01101091.1~~GEMP01101091.1.p1  ORF type:complete len:171 (+),score=24.83 GEMP01101091.1:111-623(+)
MAGAPIAITIIAVLLNLACIVVSCIYLALQSDEFFPIFFVCAGYFIFFALLMLIVECGPAMDKCCGIRRLIVSNLNLAGKFGGRALIYFMIGLAVLSFHYGWKGGRDSRHYHQYITFTIVGVAYLVLAFIYLILKCASGGGGGDGGRGGPRGGGNRGRRDNEMDAYFERG